MGRKPNGASSIYKGADGDWHGRVTVGIKDDGRPDRRHVRGKSQAIVTRKVRALERDREDGNVVNAGQRWTVKQWLEHWIETIAVPPAIRPSSHDSYRVDVETHLIPGIGAHRLDRLKPEHLEKLYAKMLAIGSSPGTAHHVHRTIRASLNVALRRGYLAKNPATLTKAPTVVEQEVEPYEIHEVKRLLKEAAALPRNGARWDIALALGLRQGEVLGLRWQDINFDRGYLWVRQGRQRPKYAHGCGETCGRKAGYCQERTQLNADAAETKSAAGRRRVGMPLQVASRLRHHRDEQHQERERAGDLWDGGTDWVFCSPTGRPLNPNTDYHQWKQLLSMAGLRDSRLHDARHTAATALLILGVPERTVMAIMGWSSTGMTHRYQHVTDNIRDLVATQIDELMWGSDTNSATVTERP